MSNEIIDKLKNAGYITVTDDSQGIADKAGVDGGGGGDRPAPIDPEQYKNDYTTIEVIEDGSVISLYAEITSKDYISFTEDIINYYKPLQTVQYRVNGGEWVSWIPAYIFDDPGEYNIVEYESCISHNDSPFLKKGDKIEFKHIGPWNTVDAPTGYEEHELSAHIQFHIHHLNNNKIADIYGNIMSLYCGDNFIDQVELSDEGAFSRTFSNCSGIRHAGGLSLPATTLSKWCYEDLFDSCWLITIPELPATILMDGCYDSIFGDDAAASRTIKCLAKRMADGSEDSFETTISNFIDNNQVIVFEVDTFENSGLVELIDNGDINAILVKRNGDNIDFYVPGASFWEEQSQPLTYEGDDKFFFYFTQLLDIWNEVGNTDLSAYHITVNGIGVSKVTNLGNIESGVLQFFMDDVENEKEYTLTWGYPSLHDSIDNNHLTFIISINPPGPIMSDWVILQNEATWEQVGFTQDIYDAIVSELSTHDDYSTTDQELINSFKVAISYQGETLIPAYVGVPEYGQEGEHLVFWDDSGFIGGMVYPGELISVEEWR